MLAGSQPASRGLSWRRIAPYLAVLAAVALVMLPVLRHPTEVLYGERSDILAQHYPFRHLQVESLRERGVPQLWNSTAFGGGPLLADPQAGIFYPPNWLHALSPPERCASWFGWLVILHLVAGAFGMLRWLEGHDFAPGPRLVGALVFVLCGKWFLHLVVPGHVVFLPLVWVPWQCFALDRLAARPSPSAVALFAVTTALCITGLHPQLLLYSQLLVLGYAVWPRGSLRRTRSGGRRLLAVVPAGVLGLALAAVQLLPAAAVIDSFVRGAGLGYEWASNVALGPDNVLTFLLPGRLPLECWEAAVFIGVLAAALTLFSPWRGRHRSTAIYFLACFAAIAWFALGEDGGLFRWAFEWLPGFDLFRYPTRVLLALGVPLGYLAAAGVEVLSAEVASKGRVALALLLAASGVVLLIVHHDLDALFAALALAAPALVLLPRSVRPAAWRPTALVLLVFLDLARFAIPLVHTRPLEEALGRNPVVERVRAPLGEGRVLALNPAWRGDASSLPTTYATPAGIESLRGFNPLVPRASYAWLKAGAARVPFAELEWTSATTLQSFPLLSREHLDLFNVRWVVSNQTLEVPGLEPREILRDLEVYHVQHPGAFCRMPETYLYENTRCLPRAALVRSARTVPSLEAAIEAVPTLDPRREVLLEEGVPTGDHAGSFEALEVDHRGDELSLSVDAGDGGYLLLSEVWYPGWRAELDGAEVPVLRANGIFQALHLPPGPHEVELRYRPPSYLVSLCVSGAAGPIVLPLLALSLRRRRRGSS